MGRFIQWKSWRMSAGFDWLQVEFRRIFPQTFVLLSFHECARHLQETYSKACRYIVGYLHVERWKMDGSSFPPPLFSPPEEGCVEIFAHCPFFLFLSFHPFSKSASSCFFPPPSPPRSEAIRELKDEGCRDIWREIGTLFCYD